MIVQVYDADSLEYDHVIRRDKYWGRSLSENGLRDALRTFFCGGNGSVRSHVVRRVLQRLSHLRLAVANQSSYRFYSW